MFKNTSKKAMIALLLALSLCAGTLTVSGAAAVSAKEYTYEITPLLAPLNGYFLVKTDNPDPNSFHFVDKASVYGTDCVIVHDATDYRDVVYEDPQTKRVNGGYIFKSTTTDGGAVTLQTLSGRDSYGKRIFEDTGTVITLPALFDEADYLINTYAGNGSFFDKMDAVQSGLSSVCLYSGSIIRGVVYRSEDFWGVKRSPHPDQSFYIWSPYSRRDNKMLFASALYPFIHDSAGFPYTMLKVSKRLDSSSICENSANGHATTAFR